MSTYDFEVKYGSLIKEETLVSIEKKILPNTFVLEATDPFPGYYEYYQGIPKDVRPYYIYFVTDRKYNLEEFTRITQNIMSVFGHRFHAAIGTIKIYNETYPIIRIRRLTEYDQIKELQSCYVKEGIRFRSQPGTPVKVKAIIFLDKFFALDKLEEGYFFDHVEPNHGYFIIPKNITWKQFELITKQVKYNIELLHFDASKGIFYENFKVYDMIRVYAENLTLELLKEICQKYIERIK